MKIELCSYINGEQYILIDHFIRHYKNLGVTNFNFRVDAKGSAEIKESVTEVIDKHIENDNIKFSFTEEMFSSSHQMKFINKCIRVSMSDWILFVDLDEFISLENSILRFSCDNLQVLLDKANADNVTYIRGIILDRVAGDLSLPDVDIKKNIHEQFPKYANVSFDISGNCPLTNKVFLIKTNLGFTYTGCRLVRATNKKDYRTHKEWVLIVDHFKWHSFFLNVQNQKCYSLKHDAGGYKSPSWHSAMKFYNEINSNDPPLKGVKAYDEFSLDVIPKQYKKEGSVNLF